MACCLVVAYMQTKFVLSKAIERKLKPVVVINKASSGRTCPGGREEGSVPCLIEWLTGLLAGWLNGVVQVDRPTARPEEVEGELLDLFCALEASDEQLDYPLVFASAKEGACVGVAADTTPRLVHHLPCRQPGRAGFEAMCDCVL